MTENTIKMPLIKKNIQFGEPISPDTPQSCLFIKIIWLFQ